MTVVSVKIGDHCYHGLCDMGASASAIPIKVEEKTITYNDPVVPTAYIEKPPFPVRIKDHAKASTMVGKSYTRTPTPPEQIKVEPSIAMVKDLLVDNIDGHGIYLCDEAARIAKPDDKDKHRPVVHMSHP